MARRNDRKSTSDDPVSPPICFNFGKHCGVPLERIPDGYLRWALRAIGNLSAPLRAAITTELDRRKSGTVSGGHGTGKQPVQVPVLKLATLPHPPHDPARVGQNLQHLRETLLALQDRVIAGTISPGQAAELVGKIARQLDHVANGACATPAREIITRMHRPCFVLLNSTLN